MENPPPTREPADPASWPPQVPLLLLVHTQEGSPIPLTRGRAGAFGKEESAPSAANRVISLEFLEGQCVEIPTQIHGSVIVPDGKAEQDGFTTGNSTLLPRHWEAAHLHPSARFPLQLA